jgi:hypothetical protein
VLSKGSEAALKPGKEQGMFLTSDKKVTHKQAVETLHLISHKTGRYEPEKCHRAFCFKKLPTFRANLPTPF